MTTMHEAYGEPNDKAGKHICCDECGYCVTCKDCEKWHDDLKFRLRGFEIKSQKVKKKCS